jgi:hypothetical protein
MEDETATMRNSSDERSSEVTDYLGALSRNIDIGSDIILLEEFFQQSLVLCALLILFPLSTRLVLMLLFLSLRNEIDTSIHTIDKLVKIGSRESED